VKNSRKLERIHWSRRWKTAGGTRQKDDDDDDDDDNNNNT